MYCSIRLYYLDFLVALLTRFATPRNVGGVSVSVLSPLRISHSRYLRLKSSYCI